MRRAKDWFGVLVLLGFFGCATTRYEEYGPPPAGVVEQQMGTEVLQATDQKLLALEERVAGLEAELSGRLSGLEATQGDLATRLMSLAEQLEAVGKQLQELRMGAQLAARKTAASPLSKPVDPKWVYEQAHMAYNARQYREAKGRFLDVYEADPEGSLADNAQYWAGECAYALKDYQGAMAALHKVFEFSKTEKADDAQFMLGQCYYFLGDYDSALVEFNRLKIDYPNSEYLGRAEAYIRKLRDQ
ncbi:MAG: tetratricopeptide repeat protein [bacterium]|nr:tetratricopeptide repeat protein [bacterium]